MMCTRAVSDNKCGATLPTTASCQKRQNRPGGEVEGIPNSSRKKTWMSTSTSWETYARSRQTI
jgi:hypothetical protein